MLEVASLFQSPEGYFQDDIRAVSTNIGMAFNEAFQIRTIDRDQ